MFCVGSLTEREREREREKERECLLALMNNESDEELSKQKRAKQTNSIGQVESEVNAKCSPKSTCFLGILNKFATQKKRPEPNESDEPRKWHLDRFKRKKRFFKRRFLRNTRHSDDLKRGEKEAKEIEIKVIKKL
jgi:hypothetical protein